MSRLQANLLLLVVALIWGSAFVAQADGMRGVGPLSFTGIRFLIGAALVCPLAWREAKKLRECALWSGPADALAVTGLGLLLMLGATLQQIGITGTTVTNAGFLTALYVPLVPLLAWLLLGTRPQHVLWPASFGCLLGTWLLSGADGFRPGAGDAWVIASSVFWALHVLFVGRVAGRMAAPFLLAFGQFLVCGLSSLIWAWLGGEAISVDGVRHAWPPILYCGAISVAVGFTAQVIGQRFAQPSDAAIILSAETVFAAIFGSLLMDDRLTAAGLAGCALILASIVAVQLAPLSPVRRSARKGRVSTPLGQ
ncbi:DMT family transporter [Accumulibacter sp.]|uniref:DMT family transporter n=1 Tax=Accumulibacter sp. TaxID=2053492 RepID=UPI0025D9556B|nr:DMT family transporter [Accumulibacter sp.]MCM8593876.1 DMT family transporter [Accumulibacter sp.]MCM8626082.1 DMT family transporter [Accumulibacter sp.]MDS4048017.1 DMT family transporter [Accumulibacter sp.]